jgi:hypothetical protein
MSFLTETLGTKAALAFLVFVLAWFRLWQIERRAQEEQQAEREEADCLRAQAAACRKTGLSKLLDAFREPVRRKA